MPWPTFPPDEVSAATRVLESGKVNYWTGVEGKTFEKEFAAYHGVPYAIALANGTVALELALWGLSVDSGEVVVSPRTFVATASAVRMRGARPVFADVDRDSGGLTAETIEGVLTPQTKAVIVVHVGGYPCEMESIVGLCHERGIALIEDCAQAHGASYRGKPVGTFGDVGCFSFCQDKILTTAGEGGMLITSDEERFKRMWSFKDHGKDYDRVLRTDHPPGFRWLHTRLGTNWRLSEVQSAVGRVQLWKLDDFVAHRRAMAAIYDARLAAVEGLRVVNPPPHIRHAYYKYYTYVEPERLRPDWSRDRIMVAVAERGVSCGSGSCPEVYLEDAFPAELRPRERLPVARELGETSLMFLVDPTVSADDVSRACDVVAEVMAEAVQP
jgi:dTDP-4-amino-4,6-dideoxygalactose transaminase